MLGGNPEYMAKREMHKMEISDELIALAVGTADTDDEEILGARKLFKELYEKYWDDISPFIKFGCLKDEKFGEKMKNSMLYKNLDHKYMTLEDIIKEAKGEEADAAKTEEAKEETKTDAEESKDADAKEEEKTRIFYVTDEVQQSQYINMFRQEGKNAVILRHNIDGAFVTHVERANETVHFQRIDADLTDDFKEKINIKTKIFSLRRKKTTKG